MSRAKKDTVSIQFPAGWSSDEDLKAARQSLQLAHEAFARIAEESFLAKLGPLFDGDMEALQLHAQLSLAAPDSFDFFLIGEKGKFENIRSLPYDLVTPERTSFNRFSKETFTLDWNDPRLKPYSSRCAAFHAREYLDNLATQVRTKP